MKRLDCIKKALIALIVLIVVPVLLNWVLRWDVKLDVITDNNGNGPATWLIFWGSYLAAICSGVMAYVAYNQNNKIREDNAARIQYEELKARYEQLSKFVHKSIKLHDIRNFCDICYCLEQCDKLEQCDEIEILRPSSYYASKNALRHYISDLEMMVYDAVNVLGGVEGEDYCQFRELVKIYNNMFLGFAFEMNQIFIKNKGFDMRTLVNDLENAVDEFHRQCEIQEKAKSLRGEGFNILLKEKKRILQFYGKTQQISNF